MIMKKLIVLFAFVMLSIGMQAQTYYRCTGDNVNVRLSPNLKSRCVQLSGGAHCGMGNARLYKGAIVKSTGKVRNGFMYVMETGPDFCWEYGWVSTKYLVKAMKCASCRGTGTTGRRCPECNGQGVYACCLYTGKELCPKCWGKGYR